MSRNIGLTLKQSVSSGSIISSMVLQTTIGTYVKSMIVLVLIIGGMFLWSSPAKAETATESSTPDIYPSYLETVGFDPSKYYLHPIKGLVGGSRDTATIREDLLLQGYESYCAAPETSISLEVDSASSVENFLDQYNGVVLDLDSTYSLDLKQGLIPLVRDTNRQQFLTSSIEEYFGFKDTYVDHPTIAEVNTAPINSLLSQSQRCQQSVKILIAQDDMCKRLQSSTQCALYTRGIPDTEFTIKKAIDEYHAYGDSVVTPITGVGWKNPITQEKACDMLVKQPVASAGFTLDRLDALRKALINTPLYIDRSYRLAFLVASIERSSPQSGQLFNFFAGSNTAQNPKHMVSVVAFKTPDFLTNKGNTETTGAVYWDDATMLTRNVLVPYSENTSQDPLDPGYMLETKKMRNDWVADAKASPKGPIECTNDPTCSDKLARALVDIINTQKPSCADLPPEYWNVISEPSGVTPPEATDPSRQYLTDFGAYILQNLFPGAIGSGFDRSNLIIESNLNLNDNTWGNRGAPLKVQFYLVYPVGYEYQKTVEALRGSFFSTNQLANIEAAGDIKETFEVGRDQSGLIPGSVTHEFETDCRLKYDPVTGQWKNVCGTDQFTFSTLEQGKQAARVLGARLGFWMRTIQKSLNRFMSGPYVFLTACTTTEDFLLGTCAESLFPPGTEPGSDLGTVAKCDPNSSMGRITSGETAEHVYTNGQCTKYDPAIHNIPNWKSGSDDAFSCDDLYSYAACTFPETLIQNPVNSSGQFKTEGSMTACEYIVDRAKKAGISPRFALAMWGEESGFSHYKVPDLGVISAPAQDLGKQMDLFIGTVKSHSSYQSFLEAYGVGQGNQYCVNPYFVGRLKTFYDYLGN